MKRANHLAGWLPPRGQPARQPAPSARLSVRMRINPERAVRLGAELASRGPEGLFVFQFDSRFAGSALVRAVCCARGEFACQQSSVYTVKLLTQILIDRRDVALGLSFGAIDYRAKAGRRGHVIHMSPDRPASQDNYSPDAWEDEEN